MTGARPVVVVSGRHRPHEMLFLALSVLLGLAYTLAAPPPQSHAAEMPPWLVHVWAGGLLLSGVVGLAAILVPFRVERALLLELGAMLVGAGALVVTTAAVFAYAGWSGLLGGGFSAAWALANLARAGQIWRDLRGLP